MPARGAARSRSAPRSRGAARRAALPADCPTCCPWCCRPVNSRPVAPRSRPVTRGSVAGPWCCRPVVPTCCVAGQLPAGCPTLPAGHSGSVAGPVVLPGQDRPHAPGPVVLPDVLRCRRAGRIACVGRSDSAGCAGAILGSLTVLRGSPEKPCAGFSPGSIFGSSANFNRPTAINGRRSGRCASVGDPAAGVRPVDLLDSRSLSRRGGVASGV